MVPSKTGGLLIDPTSLVSSIWTENTFLQVTQIEHSAYSDSNWNFVIHMIYVGHNIFDNVYYRKQIMTEYHRLRNVKQKAIMNTRELLTHFSATSSTFEGLPTQERKFILNSISTISLRWTNLIQCLVLNTTHAFVFRTPLKYDNLSHFLSITILMMNAFKRLHILN